VCMVKGLQQMKGAGRGENSDGDEGKSGAMSTVGVQTCGRHVTYRRTYRTYRTYAMA
jgi:hypothetical protein